MASAAALAAAVVTLATLATKNVNYKSGNPQEVNCDQENTRMESKMSEVFAFLLHCVNQRHFAANCDETLTYSITFRF